MKEIGHINRNDIVTLKSLEDKIQELKMKYNNINSDNILVDVDNIVFYKRDKYDIVKPPPPRPPSREVNGFGVETNESLSDKKNWDEDIKKWQDLK